MLENSGIVIEIIAPSTKPPIIKITIMNGKPEGPMGTKSMCPENVWK